MSYQVNINKDTSIYVNKNQNQNISDSKVTGADAAGKAGGSVQAATETNEGLMQAINGNEEIVRASSTQFLKNTEQYMELLEKNGSNASDDVESEEEAREREKEIYKNLSSEEIAKLKMMQVDLSSVSLSDIAGLVNTIRSEVHEQEFHQRIADICEGIDSIKGQITHDNIKDAIKSLLPEEMGEIVINSVLEEGYEINEQQMIYLLKNELQLTISNLYKSAYATSSGVNRGRPEILDAKAMERLEPQIDSVIQQSGIEAASRAELVSAAHFMIAHDIPLTAAALRNYVAIRELNTYGIEPGTVAVNMLIQETYGGPASEANVYFDQRAAADNLREEVMTISGEAISVAEQQNLAFTIQNLNAVSDGLKAEQGSVMQEETAPIVAMEEMLAQMSRAEITARRQLEEIRLSMTQSAASRLIMLDVHIDTKELADVVKQLRQIEMALAKESFADYGIKYQKEHGVLYQETMYKIAGIRQMPAAALGIAVQPQPLTINAIYEQGLKWLTAIENAEGADIAYTDAEQAADAALGNSARAKEALGSYETMMTAPRADMGDAISKAFERVDSLLAEMQVEINEENRRAVRILGYNQMEITEESLAVIADADAKVQKMLQGMTPRAVLGLIRKGQNPLDMSVDEINMVLEENREDTWVQEDERYSAFLYKLEQKKDITKEERESYIGIFRLLHKIGKQSGKDIGFVVKAGQDLTLKNLLSAHRSGQAKGINFTASDETGALESVITQGALISTQIAQAFMEYGEPMVTQVFEELQEDLPDAYAEALYEAERELPEAEDAWKYLETQGSIISPGNLQAAAAMLAEDAGIYGMIEKWLLHTETDSADETKEKSEYAAGLSSDMEELFAQVTEHFESETSVVESYEAIAEHLGEMSRTDITGVLTYQDIQSLKQIHTGFALLKQEAKQESFQVPIQTDGRWTLMHVHFVSREKSTVNQTIDAQRIDGGNGEQGDETESGKITFSMEHVRLGTVYAEIVTGAQTGGEIRTERGTLAWSQEILEKAEHAKSKTDQYALAKDIFKQLEKMLRNMW